MAGGDEVRWDAVCITARVPNHAEAYRKELLRRGPALAALLLAVSDPELSGVDVANDGVSIGSGGATLNALLLVAEHLSARQGDNSVDMTILQAKRVLILHTGGTNQRIPAFSLLPGTHGAAQSTIDLLMANLGRLAKRCPPGLFVVSSQDSFMGVSDAFCERFGQAAGEKGSVTAVALARPLEEVALKYGAYQLGPGGEVRQVLFKQSLAQLRAASLPGSPETTAMACGVVFFESQAASSLLHLAFDPAFEACSYLGIDNGAAPRGFSLFLDLLASMCTDVEYNTFCPEECGMRPLLWRATRQLRLKAVLMDEPSQYLFVRSTRDFVQLLGTLETAHSFGSYLDPPSEHARVVNSVLRNCQIAKDAIIENSSLDNCILEPGSVCTGLRRLKGLRVPEDVQLQQVLLQDGRCCLVTFLTNGTLGQSWQQLLAQTGLTEEQLWRANEERELQTARLFPAVSSLEASLSPALAWVEYVQCCRETPENARRASLDLWRRSWSAALTAAERLSLQQLATRADVQAELQWQDCVAADSNVLRARQLLLLQKDAPIHHILEDEVRRGRTGLFDVLDAVAGAGDADLDVCARALAQVAELLALMAGPEGGLRSGSARNPQWRAALQGLGCDRTRAQAVQQMRDVRSSWIQDGPVALMRAARHYEAAAQALILRAVATCSQFIHVAPAAPSSGWQVVESPARIDLAGGWTDTPPICYEHGGAVVNLAVRVDGKRPLGARCLRMPNQLELVLETWNKDLGPDVPPDSRACECRSLADLEDYNSPSAPAALLKCCVLCCGIVAVDGPALPEQLRRAGGGLRLCSWSALPTGSGLGSSSILAAAAMKATLAAFDLHMDDESLIHAVQNVEQMLTTGGGWQDQVGAILGGAKIARSGPLPLRVLAEPLPLSRDFAEALEQRLVLVFTGRPRLAKHLLQNVIRQWFSRAPEICQTVRSLVSNAEQCADALKAGDLQKLGACLSEYWAQKRVMAPGCEPKMVRPLRDLPGLLGFSLCGAGGGGFATLLFAEGNQLQAVRTALKEMPGLEDAYACAASIDHQGMELRVQTGAQALADVMGALGRNLRTTSDTEEGGIILNRMAPVSVDLCNFNLARLFVAGGPRGVGSKHESPAHGRDEPHRRLRGLAASALCRILGQAADPIFTP
ncbi:unnamed protein product [Effrenium voratum]|uniref:L-fucose kinase n=1 Tax=Effrenium voratum TaxID=2562239 RepID=A0AA36IBD7_9DINO|nr:unnamed protein product [Effrenium voratum]